MLKAIGVENDKEMESTMLQTAGDAAKIELVADLNEMKANGQDLIFVTIELTDENGVLQPNANNRMTWRIIEEAWVLKYKISSRNINWRYFRDSYILWTNN